MNLAEVLQRQRVRVATDPSVKFSNLVDIARHHESPILRDHPDNLLESFGDDDDSRTLAEAILDPARRKSLNDGQWAELDTIFRFAGVEPPRRADG